MAHAGPTLHLEDAQDVDRAAERLARGDVVAHGFANLYALTTLPDATTVRETNALKGRPAAQVGSVTTTPSRLTSVWDLSALPRDLPIDAVHALLDALYGLGPFGFRGPAAAPVPQHLTLADGGRPTVQLIAPGYACPSNRFLAAATGAVGDLLPAHHVGEPLASRHGGQGRASPQQGVCPAYGVRRRAARRDPRARRGCGSGALPAARADVDDGARPAPHGDGPGWTSGPRHRAARLAARRRRTSRRRAPRFRRGAR